MNLVQRQIAAVTMVVAPFLVGCQTTGVSKWIPANSGASDGTDSSVNTAIPSGNNAIGITDISFEIGTDPYAYADSFVAIGAERLTVKEIYPEPFGNWQGIRAEFDYYTTDGLKKRALLVGAQQNDKFYYILYEAPAMHFFDKRKKEVDEIIRSVKTAPKA